MTRRFSSMRRNLRVALPLAALVLLWELVARSGWVSAYLLPGPLAVLATGAQLLQSGVLAAHAAASLARSLDLPRWAYVACIAAELIAAGSGLGYLILDAQELQRTDVVMVGILIIGLLGWAMDWAFQRAAAALLGRRFPEVAA